MQRAVARDFSVQTKRAIVENGKIVGLECVQVEWQFGDGGKIDLVEVPGSAFALKADLVLLAMGFSGPRKEGLVEQAKVELDPRGNVKADMQLQNQYGQGLLLRRHAPRPIAGGMGDPRRPASARGVDEFLMGCVGVAALSTYGNDHGQRRRMRSGQNRHRFCQDRLAQRAPCAIPAASRRSRASSEGSGTGARTIQHHQSAQSFRKSISLSIAAEVNMVASLGGSASSPGQKRRCADPWRELPSTARCR